MGKHHFIPFFTLALVFLVPVILGRTFTATTHNVETDYQTIKVGTAKIANQTDEYVFSLFYLDLDIDVRDVKYLIAPAMVILLGADPAHTQDKNMQVTVAFNKFGEGCVQRLPRCRYGFFQVVNNDYEKWIMYAIGGSNDPTILSQGNRFLAPDVAKSKQVTQRHDAPEEEWKNWKWKSENDVFLNGAFFVPSGGDFQPTPEQTAGLIPPCTEPVEALTRDAGKLTCTPGQPC
ncbi:hypothetical protein L2E82_42868 [Cichorium intybus]|uniref:Uncharacterized protein n=1 Tax=Cichorium intybus TaxID=13427 RepID=A0ACB8ZN17_CICIN|nr:hypothetical protein L2E82_42868 [Cichorium intybus]